MYKILILLLLTTSFLSCLSSGEQKKQPKKEFQKEQKTKEELEKEQKIKAEKIRVLEVETVKKMLAEGYTVLDSASVFVNDNKGIIDLFVIDINSIKTDDKVFHAYKKASLGLILEVNKGFDKIKKQVALYTNKLNEVKSEAESTTVDFVLETVGEVINNLNTIFPDRLRLIIEQLSAMRKKMKYRLLILGIPSSF